MIYDEQVRIINTGQKVIILGVQERKQALNM